MRCRRARFLCALSAREPYPALPPPNLVQPSIRPVIAGLRERVMRLARGGGNGGLALRRPRARYRSCWSLTVSYG